jgi:hypothetical protein
VNRRTFLRRILAGIAAAPAIPLLAAPNANKNARVVRSVTEWHKIKCLLMELAPIRRRFDTFGSYYPRPVGPLEPTMGMIRVEERPLFSGQIDRAFGLRIHFSDDWFAQMVILVHDYRRHYEVASDGGLPAQLRYRHSEIYFEGIDLRTPVRHGFDLVPEVGYIDASNKVAHPGLEWVRAYGQVQVLAPTKFNAD